MLRRAFVLALLLTPGCTDPGPDPSIAAAKASRPAPADPARAPTSPPPPAAPAVAPAQPAAGPPASSPPSPVEPTPPTPPPTPVQPAPSPQPAPPPAAGPPALAAGEGRVEAVGDDEVEVVFAGAAVGARLVALRDGTPVATLVVDEVEGEVVTAHIEATDGDLWVKPGDALRREEPAKGLVVKVARVTVVARGLDVAAVLAQIGDQARKDVALDDAAPNPKVTIELRDVPWDEAVLRVAKAAKLEALLDAAGALVAKPD